MDQGKKTRGTKRNTKKTKPKPRKSQSKDLDDYSDQSEESDRRSDESNREEEQSSEKSDEDHSSEESDEDHSSEESDKDQSSKESDEDQSSEESDEDQSSEESDEDQSSEGSDSEEDVQSSEGSKDEANKSSEESGDDVNHSGKGSEDKEEEDQSSEGSDSEEDDQVNEESDDEEANQSSEGSDSEEDDSLSKETDDQSSEGSEDDEEEDQSSAGSDCEEDEQTTDEEESDPNREQDSESEDEDGDGESSEDSSSEPEQQGPMEHQPQRSGQRSRQNPEESSRKKDLDKQTQQHKRSSSKHQKSKGRTSCPAKSAKKLGRKHDIPKQKGTPPQSTKEAKKPPTPKTVTGIRLARGEKAGEPKIEQERTTKRTKSEETKRDSRRGEDSDNDDDDYQIPRNFDIRKEERKPPRTTNRKGLEYDSEACRTRRKDVRESNTGKGRESRTIVRENHGSKEAYHRSKQEVRKNNAALGFQRGFQEADPTFNERNTRTKTWGMWPNDAGQVRRDRNMNRNSYHPESQPKHAFKTNLNLDKCGKNLHAYDLVEILAKKEDLNSSMLQVIRERNVNPDDVQTVLNNHGNIFHIKSDRFCLKPRLKLCAGHSSNNGCKNKTDCVGLHICQNFLEGICKYKACNLGHKLATGHNKKVLGNFFLDRLGDDTLLRVLSKSLPKSTSNSQKGSGHQRTRHSSPNRAFLETSESDAYSLNGDDDSDADHFCGRSKRKKPSPIKKKKQIQTVWSTDSNGDVEIPEICYNSVESSCPRQDEGCEKLHSLQHFYWQISKDNSKWFNLPPKLVLCLEKSYCDVSQDGVTLPRLKGVDLQSVHIDAVKILSRDEWTSDFQSMTLKNSNHKVQLHLRRLCSEKTDSANVKANTFCWYFRDDNEKWVPYDNHDDSENIEERYLANSSAAFNIKTQSSNYILDFQKMCQINVLTNTRREIRRRPLEHLQETLDPSFLPEDSPIQLLLPREWEAMKPKERMRLVDLDPESDEYEKVITILKSDTWKDKVQRIQRNQNPYLWKTFQLRKEEMITQYGDEASVKMTDLFHGTNPDIVRNICKENFDFRLHGKNTGHIWGKGSYFGNDITFCYRYCRPDSNRLKYLIVAKVLVGTITVGANEFERPPLNPATGSLFDTTVDNETQPKVFVKYDKQDYYPHYVITME